MDLDVLLEINNKDKFLLNSMLIVTLLFYDYLGWGFRYPTHTTSSETIVCASQTVAERASSTRICLAN